MSKLYSRARTPPSSPSISQKSSTSRQSNSKSYNLPSKAYSDREYEKYEKYSHLDKYDKSKYEKSSKRDRYDKFEKSESYTSNKDYSQGSFPSSMMKTSSKPLEKYNAKREDSYRDVPIFKPKEDLYLEQSYSDRGAYPSKYPPRESDRYSKYSSTKELQNPKFPLRTSSTSCVTERGESKKYAPYLPEKSLPYSKYGSGGNSYFPSESTYNSFNSYDGGKNHSGRGKVGGSGDSRSFSGTSMRNVVGKSFQNDIPPDMCNSMQSSYGRNTLPGTSQSSKSYDRYGPRKRSPERKYLDRYVIGDSVVYGSPGHYPKDIYPPSPKAKRHHSPQSPPPPPPLPPLSSKHGSISSMGKSYSRYSPSSPKRYRSTLNKSPPPRGGDMPYSSSRLKSPVTNSHRDSSHSASYRKPPSPPPISSFRELSPQGYSRNHGSSRNYTPPPERNKGDRYDFNKDGRNFQAHIGGNSLNRDNHSHLKMKDRNDLSKTMDGFRDKDRNYIKNLPSNYQNQPMRGGLNNFSARDKYLLDRPPPPRPVGSPKPLLSIPLSVNSIPKESRANLRETLGIGPPRNRLMRGGDRDDGGRMRRFDGRIGLNTQNSLNQGRGQLAAKRRLPLSPKDRRKRRPDDLRLWIESRKSEGTKRNVSPSGRGRLLPQKRPLLRVGDGGAGGAPHRSRLLDSRRRILNKGKRKGGGPAIMKRGLKKPKRILPQKSKPRNDDRVAERKSLKRDHKSSDVRRDDVGKRNDRRGDRNKDSNLKENGSRNKNSTRGTGSLNSSHRLIGRPLVVSKTNRLPLKPRTMKRSFQRSSHERERSSNKNDKSHQSNKSEGKGRSPPARKGRESSSGRN